MCTKPYVVKRLDADKTLSCSYGWVGRGADRGGGDLGAVKAASRGRVMSQPFRLPLGNDRHA